MHTSNYWIGHFKVNADQKRVNWNVKPSITHDEVDTILASLQAWQLGETSEGKNLIAASTLYAKEIADPDYVDAVKLFVKEEQKHGNKTVDCFITGRIVFFYIVTTAKTCFIHYWRQYRAQSKYQWPVGLGNVDW